MLISVDSSYPLSILLKFPLEIMYSNISLLYSREFNSVVHCYQA